MLRSTATVAAFGLLVTAGIAMPSVASAAPPVSCAHPTFTDGLAQNVFSADTSTWVRGEAWVQTHDDSDHDGVPDRVHVDVTRPAETANPACHYQAPVVFEDSPYYAGTGPEPFWPVDYELGRPEPGCRPAARRPAARTRPTAARPSSTG